MLIISILFICLSFDWQKRQNLSEKKTILRQKGMQQPNNQYFDKW